MLKFGVSWWWAVNMVAVVAPRLPKLSYISSNSIFNVYGCTAEP